MTLLPLDLVNIAMCIFQEPKLRAPLMAAIKAHDFEETRRLLSHGADVNTKGEKITLSDDSKFKLPSCPLFWALFQGDAAIVKLLLHTGADPRLSFDLGFPGTSTEMLARALEIGDKEIVQYLLQAGGDINLLMDASFHGLGSFHRATWSKPHLLEIFAQYGADFNRPDADGNTVLHNALLNLGEDCFCQVERLSTFGADVNLPNSRTGITPLILAIKEKSPQPVIELLLTQGADPHVGGDFKRRNALHWAAKTENLWALCRLIQENVNLEAKRDHYLGQLTTFGYLCEVCRSYMAMSHYRWAKPLYCLRAMNLLAEVGAQSKLTGDIELIEELEWFREQAEWMYKKPGRYLLAKGLEMKRVHLEEIHDSIDTLIWKHSRVDTLRHICRLKIRARLRPNFRERLQMLCLPKMLYDFIVMKDLLFLEPWIQYTDVTWALYGVWDHWKLGCFFQQLVQTNSKYQSSATYWLLVESLIRCIYSQRTSTAESVMIWSWTRGVKLLVPALGEHGLTGLCLHDGFKWQDAR